MSASRHLVTADVTDFEAGPDGAVIGNAGGKRFRLDFALPGERVMAQFQAGEDVGEVVRVLKASPHRVEPRCPFFGPCGGCMWQHVEYREQLRIKERNLARLLHGSLGPRAPRVEPMLAATSAPWGFRNKVHFVFGEQGRQRELLIGHYRRHSISVLPVNECPVHSEEGNRIAFACHAALSRHRTSARHVVVRVTTSPPETLATIVVRSNDKALRPAMRSLVSAVHPDGLHLNINDRPGPYLFGRETLRLHGRDRVRQIVAGISFLISPTAFFQTNVAAAEAMVRLVLEHAREPSSVLDLYAGAGLFSLPLAAQGARVTAVEENANAIEDGEASRDFNRIASSQCRFVRSRAEDLPRGGGVMRKTPDLVVLDPPRSGCPRPVLDWICRTVAPHRLIYVSCNPEALASDLATPLGAGYHAELIQPVDMFPHTPHIETVAVLAK